MTVFVNDAATVVSATKMKVPAKLTVATAIVIGQETAVSKPDAQHEPQGETLEHLTATPWT